MAATTANHGNPKYLVRGSGGAEERERLLALLAEKLAADAARGPVTCPRCWGEDVDGRNGLPPRYRCRSCGHGWHSVVVVLE